MEPATRKVGELVAVRCPYEKISRTNGRTYICGSLCIRVHDGSSGEAHCRKCRAKFDFWVRGNVVKTAIIRSVISANPVTQ